MMHVIDSSTRVRSQYLVNSSIFYLWCRPHVHTTRKRINFFINNEKRCHLLYYCCSYSVEVSPLHFAERPLCLCVHLASFIYFNSNACCFTCRCLHLLAETRANNNKNIKDIFGTSENNNWKFFSNFLPSLVDVAAIISRYSYSHSRTGRPFRSHINKCHWAISIQSSCAFTQTLLGRLLPSKCVSMFLLFVALFVGSVCLIWRHGILFFAVTFRYLHGTAALP